MPEIVFECPICKVEIEADQSMAGDSAVCPNCDGTIMIPLQGISKGMNIGGFELEEKLGTGGMGEVWRAKQLSIDRQVALKILSPGLVNNQEFVGRFLREGKNSGKLDHPNLITAFDAGMDKGVYYLAVSFVEGINLSDKIKMDKVLPEAEALEIIKSISEALEYAWTEHKILHRDIKPSNIMIDKKGTPKLMDMGISKSITENCDLTMSGVIMGTPYYISPEQALAKPDVDFRTDIYSLGATLYHIVTGRVPYDADTALSIITMHITDKFVLPEYINPNISAHCSTLIQIMMARKPNDRQNSWAQVIKDVKLVIAGDAPETQLKEKGVVADSAPEAEKTQSLRIDQGKVVTPQMEKHGRINVKVSGGLMDRHFKSVKTPLNTPVQSQAPANAGAVDGASTVRLVYDKNIQPPVIPIQKMRQPEPPQPAPPPAVAVQEKTAPVKSEDVKNKIVKNLVKKKRLKPMALAVIVIIPVIIAIGIFVKFKIDDLQAQTHETQIRTVLMKLQKHAALYIESGEYQAAAKVYLEYSDEYAKETEKERNRLADECYAKQKEIDEIFKKDEITDKEELQKVLVALNPGYDGKGKVLVEGGIITGLQLPNKSIVDLMPLKKLKDLKSLNIGECTNIKDLTPLLECKKLEKLIVYPYLKDIQVLKKLRSLKFISQDNVPVSQMKTAEKFWEDMDRKRMND